MKRVDGLKGRRNERYKLETPEFIPGSVNIGKRSCPALQCGVQVARSRGPGLQSGDVEKRICMEKDTELV